MNIKFWFIHRKFTRWQNWRDAGTNKKSLTGLKSKERQATNYQGLMINSNFSGSISTLFPLFNSPDNMALAKIFPTLS